MSTALLAYRSITLGVNAYKGGVTKLKNKLFKFNNIHIASVDDTAQNKLLKNIEDFVKKKVLADLKRKTAFALIRMVVLAKYIAILGAVGIIGFYVGKLIYKFITWCVEIEKKYNVINNLGKLFDAWKASGSNIFIFIHQNWSGGFNLKEKLLTIITDSGTWLWNKAVEWVSGAYNFIKKTYDEVIDWFDNDILDEEHGFNIEADKQFDDGQIEVRSPYELDKTYKLNDSEVVEAAKKGKIVENKNKVTGELSDDDAATKEEDQPPSSENKPIGNDKSAVWAAKDKIKNMSNEVGAGDIFNKSLAKGSEKDVDDADKKIKEEEQKNSIESSTKITKKEKNSISSGFTLQFDNTQMLQDIEALKMLKNNVQTMFEYDESVLQTLQFALEFR